MIQPWDYVGVMVWLFIDLFEREGLGRKTNSQPARQRARIPIYSSVPKCLHQLRLSQAGVTSQELSPGLASMICFGRKLESGAGAEYQTKVFQHGTGASKLVS